jgi:uncharacterized protein (DUF1501 family)
MLTVETIGRIRREHFLRGKTIRQIARDLRVSRNTVRRVLRSGATSQVFEDQARARRESDILTGREAAIDARESALARRELAASNREGELAAARSAHNPIESFLFGVAASAQRAEVHMREACAAYRSPVDYGLYRFGLERVAALIAAGFPTRIYYVAYPNNAFDTHVTQADTHARILTYTSDHIAAFLQDMERIGRADDVAVMVFSEFGRRVAENANLGTDHGTAGLAFVAGRKVRGGHYGEMPSLTDLDDGNMRYTTDFRRVYATMIRSWMGYADVRAVLKDDFAPLDIFAVPA